MISSLKRSSQQPFKKVYAYLYNKSIVHNMNTFQEKQSTTNDKWN